MARSRFYLRSSSQTFAYFSGHGYQPEGGAPEQIIPVDELWSLHITVAGSIFDESGQEIGVRFKNKENGRTEDVFPGKVYDFPVWTTAVDDDGCPEDICIHFYLEIIPPELLGK